MTTQNTTNWKETAVKARSLNLISDEQKVLFTEISR